MAVLHIPDAVLITPAFLNDYPVFFQVHAFSPNTNLSWSECASIPVGMRLTTTTVINGRVYVGGMSADYDNWCVKNAYDQVAKWNTLPPTPVKGFGIGSLNGKLVMVGGVYKDEVPTGDVYVFEEDTQEWVKSIPPMPTGLAGSVVASHSSSLVVCGTPDKSSPASVFVYNSHSSQWHSRSPPPPVFSSAYCSAVVVNDTYYIAAGSEGVLEHYSHPSSPAVFSIPLSTLLDPNAPQDPSTWQRMPDTPHHMSHLVATGGCLLALRGLRNACDLNNDELLVSNLTTAVHAYCPAISSWVKIGDLPDLRLHSVITTLSSGELFIAGGMIPNNEHDNLDCDEKAFIGIIS